MSDAIGDGANRDHGARSWGGIQACHQPQETRIVAHAPLVIDGDLDSDSPKCPSLVGFWRAKIKHVAVQNASLTEIRDALR
jgi:hypothetical protein